MKPTDQTELATVQEGAIAPVASSFNIAELYAAVIQKGITAENVAVLGDLLKLQERQEQRQAERDFNAAFVALQHDLPVIVASTVIKNRGKYERFEDVMDKVGPLLVKHGFTVSFSQVEGDKKISQTCKLRHIAGHSQENSFTVRVSGNADSETQADCKASTTAKRNALLNALNIVIRQDALQDEENDASMVGSVIDAAHAQTLRELVKDCQAPGGPGLDLAKFLQFAGNAASVETICAGDYTKAFAALQKKLGRA